MISEDILAKLGVEVPLGKIDKTLKDLWDTDQDKTKSSLINLAIYSEEEERMEENCKLLEHLSSEHACRAIMIMSKPEEEPAIARAWLNAICHPYQGKQQVCSEQLSFYLRGGDANHVMNIVFAHLDSDLPLVVYWQESLQYFLSERFFSSIHTLMVDSERWIDARAEFELLLKIRGCGKKLDLRDMSWTRTHYIRTALAIAFQSVNSQVLLGQLDQVVLNYGSQNRVAALLLIAWMTSRLEAKVAKQGNDLELILKNGKKVKIAVNEVECKYPIRSLELSSAEGSVKLERLVDDISLIHIKVNVGGYHQEECLPADVESDEELICQQLARFGGNTHYGQALTWVKEIL
jgi:glucose-6-phosphate dehydrogenase assembly protein OpcA